jgi:serine protease Do
MNMWRSAALGGALALVAGAGAPVTPAAQGQVTVHAPRTLEIVNGWGGSHLGVSINDINAADVKAGQTGVTIEEVTEDSPAEAAGFRKGDVIVEFDGERVRSARQFSRLVQETVPGRTVAVIAMRDGQRTTLSVQPRERGFGNLDGLRNLEEFTARRAPRPPAITVRPSIPDFEAFTWMSGNRLGVTVDELSPQLAEYFGTKDGVLVTSVVDDSVAAKAGLHAGDVVTSINGTSVERPSELRRHIQRLRGGDEFTLEIVRDKKPMTIKGTIEEPRDRRSSFRTIV